MSDTTDTSANTFYYTTQIDAEPIGGLTLDHLYSDIVDLIQWAKEDTFNYSQHSTTLYLHPSVINSITDKKAEKEREQASTYRDQPLLRPSDRSKFAHEREREAAKWDEHTAIDGLEIFGIDVVSKEDRSADTITLRVDR